MRAQLLSGKLAVCLDNAPSTQTFGFRVTPRPRIESSELILRGSSTELTNRNMGGQHNVLLLCPLTQEHYAWFGYREIWKTIDRSFEFSEAAITIHVGKKGILDKDQLMRLEWVGPNASSFKSDVGHPHWQIDALDTLNNRITDNTISFEPEKSKMPVPFEVKVESKNEPNYLENLKLHRLHLASAAAWWRSDPEPVSFAPESEADIDRWLKQSIIYVRKELRRCSTKR